MLTSDKKGLLSLAAILLAVLGIGCASVETQSNQLNAEMTQWKGRDVNALMSEWGSPTRIIFDGKGGRIYVYERSTSDEIEVPVGSLIKLLLDGDDDDDDYFGGYESDSPWEEVGADAGLTLGWGAEHECRFFINSQGRIYNATSKKLEPGGGLQ